jgi:hypothetical protein
MSLMPIASALPSPRHPGVRLDLLDMAVAVFGHDLILSTNPDGRLVLHRVSGDGRASRVGTFEDVTSVWEAVDAIDTTAPDAAAA